MNGYCDPRFAKVREVFEQGFTDGSELGAAVAVYLRGEPVVDLWYGTADRHTGREWAEDTPAYVYSCTKAVTATVLLMLVERGLVEVGAPVATYWPEFGKPEITVEHVLSHQAGLPVLEGVVPVEEFENQAVIAARLAVQTPLWEPGTAHGYHALTYGFLVGEVVRRVTGKSVGELVAAEIAGPYGLEMWLGAPDEVIGRAARLTASVRGTTPGGPAPTTRSAVSGPGDAAVTRPAAATDGPAGAVSVGGGSAGAAVGGAGEGLVERMARAFADPQSLVNRALGNPDMQKLPGGANHPVIMRSGWPAAGMVATARGLAGFYRALLAGEILAPETLAEAMRRRVQGPDEVLLVDSSFGLGFMRPSMGFLVPRGGAEGAFGHTGMGGFLGLGDVRHGLAVGYTPNRMANAASGGLRAYRLLEAVYAAL